MPVVVVLLVLLLAAGATGAYLFFGNDDALPTASDDTAVDAGADVGAQPDADATEPAADTDDADGSEETPAPASDSPSTPATPTPAQRICWDDSTVDPGAPCPALTGKQGLRWVFPTADTHWRDCSRASTQGVKVRSFNCHIPVPSGGTVLATFSEFASVSEAFEYYTRPGYIGSPDRLEDGVQVWEVGVAPSTDRWRFTKLLTDLPQSVTVVDDDRSRVEEARDVIAIRPADERAAAVR